MPPGAKKRKALKKKQQQQQQEANSKGFNGDNLHGNDEQGRQEDDRESDSTLSSPGSQGNDEFAGTKDPSATISSGLVVQDTAKEISDVSQGLGPKTVNPAAVERGTDDKNSIEEKSHISSNGISTQAAKNVERNMISEKGEHAETSNLDKQKSGEKKKCPSTGLEKDNGKVGTLPESADGTSRKIESERESEAPVSSEEKRLLLPGPQAVRTSWLSCCGLFDAVTGSDR